jgi:hypothetical protein
MLSIFVQSEDASLLTLQKPTPKKSDKPNHSMKRYPSTLGLLAAFALTLANHASAQNLPAPVSGLQILDLAGAPITEATIGYSADFNASSSASTLTFVFRHDPGFFLLSDVSVVDVTTASGNLLLNGDFQIGEPTTAGAPVPDWSYFIQTGNVLPQFLGFENGVGFFDGSTQAYDGIDQTFSTNNGDLYNVTFNLASDTAGGVYQQTSTNGDTTGTNGNGIDTVVYAGNGLPPTTVPDGGSTCLLLLGGVAALSLVGMRRQVRAGA